MQEPHSNHEDRIAPPAAPQLKRRGGRGRWLAGALAALGLGLAVASFGGPGPATAVAPPPQPVATGWIDIVRPLALYGLESPDFARLDAAHEARRHEPGGGRRDLLAWGRLGHTAYLRLAFYRLGEEAPGEPSLFVEAARRAAEIGYAVAGLGKSDTLATRFGAFEVADLRLERGEAAYACLAFLLRENGGVLRVSGLSCGAPDAPLDRAALACQLDRIDLLSAGEDQALRAVFVAAERKRDMRCSARAARASWLEPRAAAPQLRGGAEPAPPAPTRQSDQKPGRKR